MRELVHVVDHVLVVRQDREPVGEVLEAVLRDQIRPRIERVPAGAVERDGSLQASRGLVEELRPSRGAEGEAPEIVEYALARPRHSACAPAVISSQFDAVAKRTPKIGDGRCDPRPRIASSYTTQEDAMQTDAHTVEAPARDVIVREATARTSTYAGGSSTTLSRRSQTPTTCRSSRAHRSSHGSRSGACSRMRATPGSSPSARRRPRERVCDERGVIAGIGPVTVDPERRTTASVGR